MAHPHPKPTLSLTDAVAIIVGVVVGAGIFATPPLVALHTGSSRLFLLAWLLGGLVSLVGALCYAELATAYPHAGGEYYYLRRAYGQHVAFLLGWARLTVIQTGSIAMLAFVFADYAVQIRPLGPYGTSIYAAASVITLTAVNVGGVYPGRRTQCVLTGAKVSGLLMVACGGLVAARPALTASSADPTHNTQFGLAMVLVLITYGGWSEAAYISAELRDVRRNMLRALVISIAVITSIYLLLNLAYLQGLGVAQIASSQAVAADLLRSPFGNKAAIAISVLIAIAVLGSVNATVFTGARTAYALGRDFALLGFLGHWNQHRYTPAAALLAQCAIALVLVAAGTWTRQGFETMVAYTTPVFWSFLLLVGLSVFVLRVIDRDVERPFRVPGYPLTPLLLCATCLYMIHSSVTYAVDQAWNFGAMLGLAVLLAGIPLSIIVVQDQRRKDEGGRMKDEG